jgi:Icc-related predicted phosphoesterase
VAPSILTSARWARPGRRQPNLASFSIYYASDVHGSDRCWRKFLNAGNFYGADAAIMGGDLTGKAIVPIEKHPDGTHSAVFLGEVRTAITAEALSELEAAIRFNGMYPWVASRAQIEACASNKRLQEELWTSLVASEIARWVTLADERLADRQLPVYVMAGNDDPWEIDEALSASRRLVLTDNTIVDIGGHELLSCSYANQTPWDSPRELPEDELYAHIKRLAEQLSNPALAIFNLHVPPYDSGLDTAPALDDDLGLQYRMGSVKEVPVGSTAVRQIIAEYQPLLAVHGHIHESRATAKIGRTLTVNPGSQYNTGHIHGALITLARDAVTACQFVVG